MTDNLSETDVRYAYRLILGREPESEEAIRNHMQEPSLGDLRRKFLNSPEFRLGQGAAPVNPSLPFTVPKIDVETDAQLDQMAAMIKHVESNWSLLGASDPHWSVLSVDNYRKEVIGDNIEQFYRMGEHSMLAFLATIDRAGLNLKNLSTCFELGCGVGRVTVALAKQFQKVIACDISSPHLDLAREAARDRSLTNIDFRLFDKVDRFGDLPEFDAFYSVLVLQHNPPPVIAFILNRVLSKLRPSGVAYFQLPTYRLNLRFNVAEYLAKTKANGIMEIHPLPQTILWQIADECGCKLLDVREENTNGITISSTVLLQKRS